MTYFLQNDHHFLNRADSKTDLKKKKKRQTNKILTIEQGSLGLDQKNVLLLSKTYNSPT